MPIDRFPGSTIVGTETQAESPEEHPTRWSRKDGRPSGVVRASVSALLIVIGAIHLHLWLNGYRFIPTIGPLFMVAVITAALLAVVVAFRINALIAMASASFAAGTLGANVLSLTLPDGLFQFKEIGVSYSGAFAIASEAGVVVGLAVWMAAIRRRPSREKGRDRPGPPSARRRGHGRAGGAVGWPLSPASARSSSTGSARNHRPSPAPAASDVSPRPMRAWIPTAAAPPRSGTGAS